MSSKIFHGARILYGLLFLVFGLNGFLQFMPNPPHPEAAGAFLGGLAKAGYMFPLIKGTEVVVGALLLSNRFVPLALTLLAPVVVNIVLFHLVLDPGGAAMSLVILAIGLYLAWTQRASYRALLRAKAEPEAAPAVLRPVPSPAE